MAILECELHGSFDQILRDIENSVLGGSMSASREDQSDFKGEHSQCAVRVYERYSMVGSNRVSLNLTLMKEDNRIFLSAITSGGSQAVFWKVNTFGEEAFLDTIRSAVNRYR